MISQTPHAAIVEITTTKKKYLIVGISATMWPRPLEQQVKKGT